MKFTTIKLFTLSLAIIFTAACQDAPESDEAVVGEAQEEQERSDDASTYAVNTSASAVEWIGTKTGGRHNGVVMVKDGHLEIEDGELTGGKFALDMTTIQATDAKMDEKKNTKLTGHLKNADFFEVDRFPDATLVITDVNPINGATTDQDTANTTEIDKYRVTNPTHEITGNLTLKNTTKSVTFPAKVEMQGNAVEAVAKFNINRRDWNIDYDLTSDAVLSDIIHLGIAIKADKVDVTAAQ